MFSGARYKVTVPKQSAIFMFALSGLRVPKREDGKDGWWLQPKEAKELSDAALRFSREKLNQLEVNIEVDGLDKGGNFVGSLSLGKKVLTPSIFCILLFISSIRALQFPSWRMGTHMFTTQAQRR